MHFVACVSISGTLGGDDALREHFARVLVAAEAREKLAVLVIAGNVVGMIFDQMLKMPACSLIVAKLHAFEGKSITGERIRRARGDELFENLTAGLLRLGHCARPRIIAGAPRACKAALSFAFCRAFILARRKR